MGRIVTPDTIGNITRPPYRSVNPPTMMRPSEPTTTGTATSKATSDSLSVPMLRLSRNSGPSGLIRAQAQKLTANPSVAIASISHGDRVAAVRVSFTPDTEVVVTSGRPAREARRSLRSPDSSTPSWSKPAELTTVEPVKKGEGQKSLDAGVIGPRPGLPARPLSPSTHRTLELLRHQAKPIELATLAQLTALHPNTVREHLDTLVGAGLVSRRREQPHRPGRPAWLYQAA